MWINSYSHFVILSGKIVHIGKKLVKRFPACSSHVLVGETSVELFSQTIGSIECLILKL